MERQTRTPTTRGPAEWFTGDVYVDAIARSQGPTPVTLGCVHFTPCAHTAWHRHSGGQTLYCTEGDDGHEILPVGGHGLSPGTAIWLSSGTVMRFPI